MLRLVLMVTGVMHILSEIMEVTLAGDKEVVIAQRWRCEDASCYLAIHF